MSTLRINMLSNAKFPKSVLDSIPDLVLTAIESDESVIFLSNSETRPGPAGTTDDSLILSVLDGPTIIHITYISDTVIAVGWIDGSNPGETS